MDRGGPWAGATFWEAVWILRGYDAVWWEVMGGGDGLGHQDKFGTRLRLNLRSGKYRNCGARWPHSNLDSAIH